MPVGSSLSAGKTLKLVILKRNLNKNVFTPSHFPNPSRGPDWNLCRTDSVPQALCWTPVILELFVFVSFISHTSFPAEINSFTPQKQTYTNTVFEYLEDAAWHLLSEYCFPFYSSEDIMKMMAFNQSAVKVAMRLCKFEWSHDRIILNSRFSNKKRLKWRMCCVLPSFSEN